LNYGGKEPTAQEAYFDEERSLQNETLTTRIGLKNAR
jgi:hypothetical protein